MTSTSKPKRAAAKRAKTASPRTASTSRRAKTASPRPKSTSQRAKATPQQAKPAPSKGTARAASAQETRAALIGAGLALVGEQGLDGPSLDAICERAGYTRGAFYVHFRDRDDFLVAVMEHVGEKVLDAVLATSGEAAGLDATIARFLAAVTSGLYPLTPQGGIRPHQLLDACARSPQIRARYVHLVEESVRRLRDVVEVDQRAGTLTSAADAEQLAVIMLAAVIGAQTMLELGVRVNLGAAASALLALLRQNLPGKPGRVSDRPG